MLKPFVVALLIATSLSLSSCSTDSSQKPTDTSTGNSKSQETSPESDKLIKYTSSNGYEFLHPQGWKPVDSKEKSDKVDVAFRDSVKRQGNLYVVISKAPKNKSLEDLGNPSAFGERLVKNINNIPNTKNKAELIGAKSREAGGKTYYTVEYKVKLPDNKERHNLATITDSQGKLFTFTLSAPQDRWDQVKSLFEEMANSFSVK
jgi:photosystem II oxygen-evolving enhancer protein 2